MCSISIDTRKNQLYPAMALVTVALLGSVPAFGQDKLRDPAAAEALYLSGRKLVADGNWTEGCEKFRASMELNPAASTLINIAKCSEHDGKLTQALVEYRRASQLNQDTLGDERRRSLEEVLKEGIAALEKRLVRVQLVVTNRPNGIEIKRDGLVLPIATIGETIPLDPGEHVFVVSAPGFRKEERKVVLKEGESLTIELPLVAESGGGVKPPASDKPNEKDKPAGRGVPAWAFVAGGIGLAAIGGAVYFKLDQSNAEKALIEHCGVQLECDPNLPYDPADDNARKNRSFGLFVGLGVLGAAGVGTAIVGFVRGARPAKPKQQSLVVLPYVGRGDGGVVLRGAF
jgi:hypothetical protein